MKSAPDGIDFEVLLNEAASAFSAPVAFAGVLEGEAETIVASRGWSVSSFPLPYSFAALLANASAPVIVQDTLQDERFRSHPLVTGAPNVRFYAGAPFFDAEGAFRGAISILDSRPRAVPSGPVAILNLLAQSVTHGFAAAAAVEEANTRFREFFEQTDDLVLSISADGRLLHANETALNTLGLSRDDLGRAALRRSVDADVRDSFVDSFEAVMKSGEPYTMETTFVTASGARIVVEGSLRPKVINGEALLARVVFRDITDRKHAEAELGNARDGALEAARLKTQFLTNVSHEIRTPMNGIVGMIDLLLATSLTEEQSDYSHQARASAEQLLALVNNILYVSSVEAGSLAPPATDFDLHVMLKRIVEVMEIAVLGKDIDIALSYDPKLGSVARGNQGRLRQVLTNLMDNAVKFTEEGSVRLNVTLEKETDTHRVVRFEVRDTGIGISPESRVLLFEKFSQVEASSTRRYQGVGLGLATARQLVETMGGLIDVESAPGFGSTFWFTIPFAKQTIRRPIQSSDLEFKGKRVLLIDHYATSRKIVRHYLETTWGMRVETVDSTAPAVVALQEALGQDDPFRVVMYDAASEADALTFAKDLRADEAFTTMSLVFLAPAHGRLNEERFRDAGINAYVRKPVGQGELFDALTLAMASDAVALARPAEQPDDSRPVPAPVSEEMRRGVRVLVAEDNHLNMKLTMRQLEKLGYPAASVANGREALDAVAAEHYDVILMDCQMPVLDGYRATIEIRRLEQDLGRRHRIIAMTANALEGDREKCLAAGMDDYLAKPTRHDDLDAALARYFSSSRSSDLPR